MQVESQSQANWTSSLFAIVAIAILVSLSALGGTPPDGTMAIYIVGVILTIGGAVFIAAAGWHLLFRPLPAGQKVVRKLLISGQARYIVGLLMVIGLVNIAIGSVWDEIWHSKYGIPFGQDFLWRPHQMLYFGFLVTIGIAAWGMYQIISKGEGTLQQRFRADPVVGFAIISGAYLAFALPADPAWHSLYGEDLAAWSLPHIVLLVMIIVMSISAASIQLSSTSERGWALLSKPTWSDVLMIIIFSMLLVGQVLVFIVEWYFFPTQASNLTNEVAILATRPAWLLPSLLLLISVFIGGMALFTTRRAGVLTVIVLLALGARYLVEVIIQSPYTGTTPYAVIVPAMIALDATYAYFIMRKQQPKLWIAALVLTLVFAVIGLPAMNALFVYPEVTLTNAPVMIIAVFVVSFVSLWMAEVVGDFIRGLESASRIETNTVPAQRRIWIDGAVYAGFSLFALFLMLTAAPPA